MREHACADVMMDLSRRALVAALGAAAATPALPTLAAAPARAANRSAFSAKSTDGVVLSGEAQGDPAAPEILFIHGLRQSGRSWEGQFADPVLAKYRMVRFDLRGHGDSDKPSSPAAYSDLGIWGDDVAAVISAANLRRPVLVGWSLGGAVISGYLSRTGGRSLAGINLVDAVTKFSPDFLTPLSVAFSKSTSSHDLEERSRATAEFLRACYVRPPTGREFEALLVINGMTARAVTEGLSIASVDLDPVLKAYDGPLLVTHGVRDRLLKVAMSQHNTAIHPGAQLSLYPDAGHSPFYEDAPRFNRELAAFVAASSRKI